MKRSHIAALACCGLLAVAAMREYLRESEAQGVAIQPPPAVTATGAPAASQSDVAAAQAAAVTQAKANADATYMTLPGTQQVVTSTAPGLAPVQSVANRTGAVSLAHTDLTDWNTALSPYALTSALPGLLAPYETITAAQAAFQPLGSYATTAALTSATSGLLSASGAAALYQPLGAYALASSLASYQPAGNYALTANLSPVALAANVGGTSYIHHYASATMTVPSVGLGAIGTGTITIAAATGLPAPAPGDLCMISPTAATTALSYMIGTGWVTTAGTIKVALEAGTLVAITSGTLGVNVMCLQ